MRSNSRIVLGLLVSSLLGSGLAAAELRPMAIDVPGKNLPKKGPRPAILPAAASHLLFVHRCPDGGCVIHEGNFDDSRTDQSVLAMGTVTIGAFTRGDVVWQKVMNCVRATYAPFNIGVTDIDPGNVPHYENVVGGQNSDLRNDIPDAGGVAPSVCLDVPNAMTYTFDVWGNNADVICAVIAQESGHAFGLEHEINASDPMTYLNGPYPKRFSATPTQCGEFQARPCDCLPTGQPQNSYQYLLDLFGAGVPTAPLVAIASPAAGKTVQPHFITRIDATDDVAVEHVELLVDGEIAITSTISPYKLIAPDLAEGPHTLEARAYDLQGTPATSAPVDIDLGPPCTAVAGCEGKDVCVQGLCVAGPDAPGGLGYICQADTECLSGQCQTDGATGDHFCVESCDLSAGSCPSGFSCIATGAAGVCWPDANTGCCDAGVRGSNPAGPALLGLGIVVLVLRRRRR